MDYIHDAERETVESELSFPLDRNNPKCGQPLCAQLKK